MKIKALLFLGIIPLMCITIYNQITNNSVYLFEGFLEAIQAFIIIICLLLTWLNRKNLKRMYKRIFFIRIFLFLFLLYEELSFFTFKICSFCDRFNSQGEFNIHNSFLLDNDQLFHLPVLESVSSSIFINTLVLLFISSGAYLPIFDNLKGIFLEKKYILLGNIILIERVIFYCLSSLGLLALNIKNFFHPEFIELIIYIIFLFDVIDKNKLSRKFN